MTLAFAIVTRFNIASPGREQAIRLRPGWLDGRFELFERYCLPGIESQTDQDFTWFILFDQQTPSEAREKVERLRARWPFRPIYTDAVDMDVIAPRLTGALDGDHLLTARLDSDDMLGCHHVERLKTAAQGHDTLVLNCDLGVVLSVDGDKARLYEMRDDCNPFAAMLEPMQERPRTIWAEQHRRIHRLGPVRAIDGPPSWMQVVHGGNVTNAVSGRRVPLGRWADQFPRLPLDALASAERGGDILWDNSMGQAARLGRRILARFRK